MRIGELAKTTGLSSEIIRYYEKIGLLDKPARSQSNQRIYQRSHLDQLKIIRQLRSLDFSLREIGLLFEYQNASTVHTRKEVKSLVARHITKLDVLLENTLKTRDYLLRVSELCDGSEGPARDCPILEDLISDRTGQ